MNSLRRVIDSTQLETPLGTMLAGALPEGICLLEFTDRKKLETQLKILSTLLKSDISQGHNLHFETLKNELDEYFEGRRKLFTVPLFYPGSEFQKMVWQELQNIPYGSTRTYKEQAIAINKPRATRAVANANGKNRIAIIIPCHRVISGNGDLTGYAGGIWRKEKLIEMENSYR
jgi:AraC family transcriptional regulator, regulatory protein of adaptative response / methylated-DNA-[protein]-cysteine methyltransferase